MIRLRIQTITTVGELNEFEQQNIEKAIEWTLSRKFTIKNIATEEFVRELHYKMLGDVWKWAGEFRQSNKNIGGDWKQVATLLKQLNDDSIFWVNEKIYMEDEIAIQYKHRIVNIHCFPNGNGRHSRLMADIIIDKVFDQPIFTWSRANLNKKGEVRSNYIKAIREADKGNIKSLMEFART